jgi:tetratricopeptide (TPR) repeat protein
MTDQFSYDIFLSHSSKDKTIVRTIAERLRSDGLKVWFDDWEIKPGDSIPAKIEDGLERSRVLVLFMSKNAFGSDWAQLESGTFHFCDPLNKERRFIPLRLDDTPIKGSLAQFLYIDWRHDDHEQEYIKLVDACRIEDSLFPKDYQGGNGWCLPRQQEVVSDRNMRDEFSKKTKETLVKRVGMRCSNPGCRKLTSGPQADSNEAINIGVAAHITAASTEGPRYQPSLSKSERSSIGNGIWLCQNCAKLVDNDPATYTIEKLNNWKTEAEAKATEEIEGKGKFIFQDAQTFIDLQNKILDSTNRLGPDRYVVEAHNSQAEIKLILLLQQRSIIPNLVRQQLIALEEQVVFGDLKNAETSIRAKIIYWAARMNASEIEKLPIANSYLEKLRNIDHDFDVRIIEALMLECKGNKDGSLKVLREINTPDGRSTFFIVLSRAQGEINALAWFDDQIGHDHLDFFTGVGWRNLAITLAKQNRWSEAIVYLHAAEELSDECPDIFFVEGVMNASMLLPEELRPYTLEMNLFHSEIHTIEGCDVDKYRADSKRCFQKAYELYNKIDQKGRAQGALDWYLWLRLTDPNRGISDEAKKDVSKGLQEIPRAIELIPFARAFNIEFDESPIKHYLLQRKRTGGLENRELLAELFLAEMKMPPRELVDFIQIEEERLSQVILKATLSSMLIEALVRDGQTKRARETLEARKADLAQDDYQRLETLIDANEGTDPRARLENIYSKTGLLLDLKNLVSHLKNVGDWVALQPKLEELFQKEKTAANARKLVYCFQRNPQGNPGSLLKFIEENQDIVDTNDDLLSEKAWVLSHAGRLEEADKINKELLIKRFNDNDLELDINIALQSGDWDRFSVIIEKAMSNREKLGPHTLIRLASLAAEVDFDNNRAFELSKMAVEKGIDDPQLLMEAYTLAVQIGREDQTSAGWLTRAIELSSENGPLMKVDIRTLAKEMVPAHRERVNKVEQDILKGKISLQVAASTIGQSLSRILIEIPKLNSIVKDGRKRVIVPIRSGSRRNMEMKAEWKVCLDATSIMILKNIDLLRETINAFQKIILNSDTMIFLLNEKRRARFHQPSLIKRAEEFRSFLDRGLIKIAPPSISNTPLTLINEVGKEFADMLTIARTENGRIIRPFPIYKISSFMESEAELGDYAGYVISTKAFVKLLFENRGIIDSETFNRAHQYLTAQDRGAYSDKNQSLIDCPIYLDDLSITYLQHLDLLNIVCSSGLAVFVHQSTVTYQSNLVEASRGGTDLAATLNDIRIILHKAYKEGKINFLPRFRWENEDDKFEKLYQVAPTIANIIEDSSQCDAVCIDDRFINKHIAIIDKKNQSVPLVCLTDILQHLEIQRVINAQSKHIGFHKLRQAGYAFIPILPDELEQYLRNAHWDKDGSLIENAEMRLMRQTLMRIRSLDMIVLPEESPFLEQLHFCCIFVIRRIWEDESMELAKVITLSNWIWQNIDFSPFEWVKNLREPENKQHALEFFARHHSLLVKPINLTQERYEAFLKWIEDDVINPLLAANSDLVDVLANFISQDIEHMAKDVCDDKYGIDS